MRYFDCAENSPLSGCSVWSVDIGPGIFGVTLGGGRVTQNGQTYSLSTIGLAVGIDSTLEVVWSNNTTAESVEDLEAQAFLSAHPLEEVEKGLLVRQAQRTLRQTLDSKLALMLELNLLL